MLINIVIVAVTENTTFEKHCEFLFHIRVVGVVADGSSKQPNLVNTKQCTHLLIKRTDNIEFPLLGETG